MKIPLPHIVYHVAGMGDWKDVVNEQLTLLRECELHTADIRITYLGTELTWLEKRLKDYGIHANVVYSDPNLEHCETIAMQEVEKIAKKEESNNPILYFHTKGVSNPASWEKKQWRWLMQEHVIRQWKINLHHLKDHDAVGVNWHEGGAQHFSGTMWIANPSWIRRLPPFVEYHHNNGAHRYTCEMWIGAAQWCKAKSLACRNEPFWNSWFPFGNFMPPAVRGHFDYRGVTCNQHSGILDVFPDVLQQLKPVRVIEIGTGDGGLIRFIRHTLDALGMKSTQTIGVDPLFREAMNIVKQEGTSIWVMQPFGVSYRNVHDNLVEAIGGEGRSLILCDGSDKGKEFAAISEVAKIGDIVAVHDYAPDASFFSTHLEGKQWNWWEVNDTHLAHTVEKYGMERVCGDELQKVVWAAYEKKVDTTSSVTYAIPTIRKIGLGILTYNRPDYFTQVISSVVKVLNKVDVVYVYNDGSFQRKYFTDYANLPSQIRVCHFDVNRGVSRGKNHLLSSLLQEKCEHIFLMEDDIIIKDGGVFNAYIQAGVPGKLEHLNFAHHGPANESGAVSKFSEMVDLFPNVVGAFSYYTNNCLQRVGLMDENFKNVWEHVEHTARIVDAQLTTPFWQFADINNSKDYLEEIPGSIAASSIRGDAKWEKNVTDGLEYWKTKLLTTCPL